MTQQIQQQKRTLTADRGLTIPVTEEEFADALKPLKLGKAPGVDGILSCEQVRKLKRIVTLPVQLYHQTEQAPKSLAKNWSNCHPQTKQRSQKPSKVLNVEGLTSVKITILKQILHKEPSYRNWQQSKIQHQHTRDNNFLVQ